MLFDLTTMSTSSYPASHRQSCPLSTDRTVSAIFCYPIPRTHGVGASKATAAQAAWQLPKAVLHAAIVAGAVAPSVAPHVAPPAA